MPRHENDLHIGGADVSKELATPFRQWLETHGHGKWTGPQIIGGLVQLFLASPEPIRAWAFMGQVSDETYDAFIRRIVRDEVKRLLHPDPEPRLQVAELEEGAAIASGIVPADKRQGKGAKSG